MSNDPPDDAGSGISHLPVGDYEVMIVDVEEHSDELPPADRVELSLVVLAGPLKGQVVELGYPSDGRDLLELLGRLGTLSATGEVLSLRLEG